MKAIMVMYDSLNRHMLSPYGCDWTQTPNFKRLADRCVTFDKCYVGSLPCMPARREIHTGRYNFLHRSWGPMEPYDDSMPEILKKNGIYSHLISDHYHYWEDGGCTYHNRYSSWENVRGQEGDHWKACVGEKELPPHLGECIKQDMVNREYADTVEKMAQTQTFQAGMEFLDRNHESDNWFLQVETFDPHEPFYVQDEDLMGFEPEYDGPFFDWPGYHPVTEEEKPYVRHVRNKYAALLRMCDRSLGRILDKMDEYNLWEDTMLIVNTDHGFMLGEHDWWAKSNHINYYEEIVHTPLFIYDPRSRAAGRCDCLVQTIDLAPTVLDFFGLPVPDDMLGHPLGDTIAEGKPVRSTCLYGTCGSQISCTDGHYAYILAPADKNNNPLYNYTLMPTHMRSMFPTQELQELELSEPFSFTKGCRLLKITNQEKKEYLDENGEHPYETLLFDLEKDPGELSPISDPALEAYFRKEIARLMKENDAPAEQYERMGLLEEAKEIQ